MVADVHTLGAVHVNHSLKKCSGVLRPGSSVNSGVQCHYLTIIILLHCLLLQCRIGAEQLWLLI